MRPWAEAGALSLVAGAYLFFKATTQCVTLGDQSLYFYASALWADGVLPYRDFFLSHPPGHILVSAAAVMLAGPNLPMLLALPSLFGLLSGLLTCAIARRAFGFIGAILTLSLFLFSLRNLLSSSYFTGVNVATFWLLLGTALFTRGRALPAGVALGLGVATGVYVAVGAGVLLLVALVQDRWTGLRLGAALVSTIVLVNLAFLGVAGWSFVDQVYGYHLAKEGASPFFPSKVTILRSVLNDSWPVAALAGGSVLAVLVGLLFRGRAGRPDDAARRLVVHISIAMLVGYALFLLLLQRIFTHYFLLLLPFALLVGVDLLVRLLRWRPAAVHVQRFYTAGMWLVVVSIVAGTVVSSVSRFRQERGLRCFHGTEEIARYVAATLGEGQTIFGDFGVAPLIGLVTRRRVAANEIESSIMRFESGTSSLEEMLRAIERDDAALFISRHGNGIIVYPPFQRYLLTHYVPARRFPARHPWLVIDVWRRK